MKNFTITKFHYWYLLFLFVAAVLDLALRSWQPVEVENKNWQQTPLPQMSKPQQPSAELMAFLTGFKSAEASQKKAKTKPQVPADAKQIGQYYLALYAIYQSQQQYVAILSVQNADGALQDDATQNKLRHWRVDDGLDSLKVVAINGTDITIQQGDNTVTLRLFEKKKP